MLALEDLASKSESQLEGAMTEATSGKQRLYVLQQGWTSTVGGASLLPLCGICLQRGVDTACVPCGHTFCHECASKLGKQRTASRYAPPVPCHVCRSAVQIKQKVFFRSTARRPDIYIRGCCEEYECGRRVVSHVDRAPRWCRR